MQTAATANPPRLLTKQPPRRPQALRIRGKLFDAIELIVFDGLSADIAAKQVEMTTFQLRQSLSKAHVIAHVKARREVLRASLCGSNIKRLGEIRDAANNMPAIQAIRTLEDLDAQPMIGGSGITSSPGITIRILNVVQSAATGDAAKLIEGT